MGSGTPEEIRSKREYSLAYNRASAVLRRKHPEEFKKLVFAFLSNIRMERELNGGVTRDRPPIKHKADESGERCEECGKPVPCPGERDRLAAARKRERE